MKALLIALFLASTLSISAAEKLSGDSKGKDSQGKDSQMKYKLVSVEDGPIIKVSVEKANPKKMGQIEKVDSIDVLLEGNLIQNVDMTESKKYLSTALAGKTFKVGEIGPDWRSKFKDSTPMDKRIGGCYDIIFSDGQHLADLYADWLAKQAAIKKASTPKAPAAQ